MKRTIHEISSDIPVLGEYDVVVCGGAVYRLPERIEDETAAPEQVANIWSRPASSGS